MVMTALSALRLLAIGLPIGREAQLLYKTVRERRSGDSSTAEDVGVRLDGLDADQERQAELIARIAARNEELAQALRVVSARATVLVWVSGVALVLAFVAVGVALLQ